MFVGIFTLFGLYFFHPGSEKVKVDVSHHKLDDGQWKRVKSLAFVLDNIPDPEQKTKKVKKEKKKSKAKDNGPTNKNFGAYLDISKCKCSKSLGLAWRCRLLGVDKFFGKSFVFQISHVSVICDFRIVY